MTYYFVVERWNGKLFVSKTQEGPRSKRDRQAKFRMAYVKAGKKLDMGKSCVRFKRLEDLPLDVIGDEVASTTPEALIATHERSRAK